jgi:hypothetical protein
MTVASTEIVLPLEARLYLQNQMLNNSRILDLYSRCIVWNLYLFFSTLITKIDSTHLTLGLHMATKSGSPAVSQSLADDLLLWQQVYPVPLECIVTVRSRIVS